MKIGDLAVWTKKAAQWSNGPPAGEVAGIVIGYQKNRRAYGRHRPARVRIHDGIEAFYISPDFVEVANESR
jgi:hypothetical protein